ncbi:ankyrin repeat and IBR domain-containing protein 1-like [Anthonomus grandis grandis]|uniref:ankyrin repeat and IBR domain-containing protein 1-like n=1 Tax=Anthonomus grandis grandis TaxID=2921223 RepID=UPI0021655158|nr:ankyrin repeat and IBR domain-containing protein 1-like [Anthonomus grandis grandis]
MGSTSSKFKKNLQQGDEYAAMKIYQNSPELRKYLDPNVSYGENHSHNTALHYAAKHGMKHLLRAFINELNGNPNKKNNQNETVLHSTCQIAPHSSYGAHERRAACVQLLLHWRGATIQGGERERVDLGAQDKVGNTALHCAANSGLRRCVELLVYNGAPLFLENNEKMTPCDLAMRAGFDDIAGFLESRMVFTDNADLANLENDLINEQEEVYSGLRSQDLQEAKDQLLVDTSDMLKIPLFTAEALLRDNEWSRELLLEKWMKNPADCCEKAGVQAPSTVLVHAGSLDSSISNDTASEAPKQEVMCEICLNVIPSEWEHPIKMSCNHLFCKCCWQSYLTTKIQDGDAHHILCPAYQCHILVPVEFIEKLVSPEMARRYLQFDIKAFVESNKTIKWCPIPGCGRAVRLPEAEQTPGKTYPSRKPAPLTSHAVDCGNAHFFCWECLGDAHAPCGCDQWQQWHKKISEVKPEELNSAYIGTEEAANCLWLVTNSKPCPNCKSPIQKNEGCNHMKCSKCKFDFCWVCQESWKKHSSATGGYFRCNRFEAVRKADEKQGTLVNEAIEKSVELQEITRFLHYYTRFRNHENSQKMEEPLLTSVRKKMEVLASSLGIRREEAIESSTRFIEDGVRELLKARRVLCGSYAYGYYLEDDGYNRHIFEFMQNELEEITEKLSEMIARPYLRTPKAVIVQTSTLTRRKRHEFVRAVAQGLIPPETPPTLRKRKRKLVSNLHCSTHIPEVHVSFPQNDLEDTSTWIKDCDWPGDYDTDEETDLSVTLKRMISRSPIREHECGLLCSSQGCGTRPDYNVELIIALEMSRLQMIEDQVRQSEHTPVTPDPGSSISTNSNESTDDQLKLAIHLSLQESTAKIRREMEQREMEERINGYQKTNADLTVDYFLKSLANHKIDLKALERMEPDREVVFRSCKGNEDGRFKISDIHENGYIFGNDDYDEMSSLKRCHSTGDICPRRTRKGPLTRMNGTDEPRYHLDSDHSSQHEEKPEDMVRRYLALPSTSIRTKQFLLFHNAQQQHHEEEFCQGQSSMEDTTISDSLNADMEVSGILNSTTDEDLVNKIYEEETKKTEQVAKEMPCKKHSHNPFASLKAKLCSTHLPKSGYLTKLAVNKSIGLISSEHKPTKNYTCDHTTQNAESSTSNFPKKSNVMGESKSEKHSPKNRREGGKNIFSRSTGFLVDSNQKRIGKELRIKICKSPQKKTALETDSSNEYESETGIPKSPTLFISGVSISRTPEPKSPGISLIQNNSGRQSRSSSLSVPVPLSACSLSLSSSSLNTSNNQNNYHNNSTFPPEPFTPSLVRSHTPASSRSNLTTPHDSPRSSAKENGKSKSASEPEREREMFRFPKSSTDGALSSVLHVQESNLSSDDFHEALFLLERSPKTRDSKRRKKSKKKEKDEKKDKEQQEESSVL